MNDMENLRVNDFVLVASVVDNGRYTGRVEVVEGPSSEQNNIAGIPKVGTRGSFAEFAEDYPDALLKCDPYTVVSWRTGKRYDVEAYLREREAS